MTSFWKRAQILFALNLVALAVTYVPHFVGRDYSESVSVYVHGVAFVWLTATNLYVMIVLPRTALAEMRQRHERELAELAAQQR